MARTSSIVSAAFWSGADREVSTIRPAPPDGHLLGQEQPEATQAAGDDVGAVGPEDANLFGRQHDRAAPGLRDVQDELAGVLGGAHRPDRGRRLGERVVRAFGHRQRAVGGEPVDGGQQFADLVGMGDRHQPQVDGVEHQVATEREQPQPGVAVDIALADLDESTRRRTTT